MNKEKGGALLGRKERRNVSEKERKAGQMNREKGGANVSEKRDES